MIRGLLRASNPAESFGASRRTQGKPETFNSGLFLPDRFTTERPDHHGSTEFGIQKAECRKQKCGRGGRLLPHKAVWDSEHLRNLWMSGETHRLRFAPLRATWRSIRLAAQSVILSESDESKNLSFRRGSLRAGSWRLSHFQVSSDEWRLEARPLHRRRGGTQCHLRSSVFIHGWCSPD